MDYSFRKTSFDSSSHGSSSFKNRSDNDNDSPTAKDDMNSPSTHGDEVIVKIDSPLMSVDGITLWRGSSEDFSFPRPLSDEDHRHNNNNNNSATNNNLAQNDPTSKLIGNFLEQEKAKGEMSLDMDMEMEELRQQTDHKLSGLPPLPPDYSSWSRNQSEIHQTLDHLNNNNTNIYQYKIPQTNTNNSSSNNDGSKETRVSFHDSLTSKLGRRPSSMYTTIHQDSSSSSCTSSMARDDENNNNYDGPEIRRCPSNKNNNNNNNSCRRMSLSKTKSRLMDHPSTPLDQRSGILHKSGQLNMKSGLVGKYDNDDEEDPFLDDDLPDEFRNNKAVSTLMVLECASLILILFILVVTLFVPILREKPIWNMKLWKWEVLVLVLICGRLVSDWGIRAIVYFIERNFLLRKRVLYFVYGLKKAVQNVIWLGLVLLTWYFLFDKRVLMESRSEQLRIVTKLLIICESGAILWLLKTLLVKVLASNFHVKAFFERIQESLFNQFVIETLSAPPLFELHNAQQEVDQAISEVQSLGVSVPPDIRANVFARNKSGRSMQRTPNIGKSLGGGAHKSPIGQSSRISGPISKKNDDGISIDHLHKMNQRNISAWNMKRLMKIIRHGSLTTLDEQIEDVTNIDADETTTQIRSEVEAKAAARKIFRNVGKPHSRYIYLDDILRFMREDEALRTMSLFEGAIENERISKKSLKNWVVNAFRERRALALTLSDTKTAVNKLHKMVNVLVSISIIILGFIYLDIITSQNLLFLSSQIVVVAFVFGNTCKNIFESIIFLFVIHPFDVGDRCEIDDVQMVVEEINILTTVFLRYDNQKIVFPNYILLTKPIHNYYRSPDMGDGIELCFHIATPADKIAVIRQRITSYIENKKEHWYPSPMVILKDTDGLQMLRLAVWLQHRMNHQDMGERWARRALLIEECVKIFREMDIEYRVYPMNVNVKSIPHLNYAQAPQPTWHAPSQGGKEVVHP